MFISGASDNPNYKFGIFASRIGDYLAEMIVICVFELILNDHLTSTTYFLGEYISAKAADA